MTSANEGWPITFFDKDIRISSERTTNRRETACVTLHSTNGRDLFRGLGENWKLDLRDLQVDAGGYVCTSFQPQTLGQGSAAASASVDLENIDGVAQGLVEMRFIAGFHGGYAGVSARDCEIVGTGSIVDCEFGQNADAMIELERCSLRGPLGGSVSGAGINVQGLPIYNGQVDLDVESCAISDKGTGIQLDANVQFPPATAIDADLTGCVVYGCGDAVSADGNGVNLDMQLSIFRGNTNELVSTAGATTGFSWCFGQTGAVTANFGSQANPMFVEESTRDFHLRRSSPCIDYFGGIASGLDIDSDPRGQSQPPTVQVDRIDVGVDEFYDRTFYFHPAPPKIGGGAQLRSPGDGTAGQPWLLGVSGTGSAGFALPAGLLLVNPLTQPVAQGVTNGAGEVDALFQIPNNPSLLSAVLTLQMVFVEVTSSNVILHYSPNALDLQLCN